jgi:LacI family transcriptional regulator
MKKGTITIKDIASELNISPSTVSRALADNPLVKPATRKAVKELAKKYNYQPNYTALSLRSNKTKTLGIIIPQIVHEFFALVIRGIEDFAYSNGYNVIISSTHESYEREVIDAKALLTGRIDGLLACISRTTENYDHFKEFDDRGIPLVFFDCICDEIDTHKVVIDDLEAAYVATRHLIEKGCKNIAYVGGPKNLIINKDRFQGFQKAIAEAGLTVDKDRVVHCDTGNFEDGKIHTAGLFDDRTIDGLFAGTDMLAVGAMKNMKEKGIRIPDDIKVVGFSNWTISSLYEPSITTVNQPGYEMGQKAAELLIHQINNPESKDFQTVVLQTELIKRESTD